MPYLRRRRRRYVPRRRRYGRSRYSRYKRAGYSQRPRIVSIRRPVASLGSLAPARSSVTLNYCGVGNVTGTATTFFTFHLNSANKPATAVDKQARGFDQWVTLYRHVMVTSFRISLKAVCLRNTGGGTNEDADVIFMVMSPGTTVPDADYTRVAELPYSKTRYIPARTWQVVHMSMGGSTAKIYGVKELDPSDFAAVASTSSGADPTKVVYCRVGVSCADLTVAARTRFMVEISQTMTFFDPKAPAVS